MLLFKRQALLNLTLLAFLVPAPFLIYYGYVRFIDPNRHVRETEIKLSMIKDGLLSFKNDVGRLPTSEEGLRILVNNSAHLTNWKGPYIISEDVLTDAWGSSFSYQSMEDVVYVGSAGENRSFDTALDDIKMKRRKGDDILLFL